MKSINPFTEEINREFESYSYEACVDAIKRAEEAFKTWKKMPVSERLKPIAEVASIFRSQTREFAGIATIEMGKPIKQSLSEIEKCAIACDYYHDNSERFLRDEVIETSSAKSYVTFEPLGKILGIMPWNFPFWQVVRWALPTLAAGNVCLLKHASNVPITALEIEKIFRRAGFPEGVFQTLLIGSETAERLIEAGFFDGISLTGSVQAGSKVASVSGKTLHKHVLELGGSDPFLVLEDADIDKAASAGVSARVVNAGQSCIAAKRFIVSERVIDRFLKKFIEKFSSLKIGDPMDEKTNIGPLAREEFLAPLSEQLDDAVKKGAKVHFGPEPPPRGFFFRPAVLTGVKPGMKVLTEEVFGPLAPIISASSEEEMVRIANDTEFGLGAAIWSKNIEKAEKIAREIATGFVAINGIVKSDPRLPFGGVKRSGYGRELSHYGLKEFVNIKTVVVGD